MTPLELQIKTVADLHGVTLTEDALQRVKERTQATSAKFEENTRASSGVTQAMKDQAQETLRNMAAQEKAAASAEKLGRNINSAKTAYSGLRDVVGGALSGNIGQVGEGLGKISSAASNASPAMKALFGQIARGASAAMVVAGPLIVAIAALKQIAAENEAAMKRMWDAAAAGAETYRKKSAEVKAAAEADLAALSAAVEKLAGEYDALTGRMDRAMQRQKELDSANKELALAKAKTPEERAAIEAQFAARGLEGEVTQAGVRERNAQDAINQANQNIRNAEASVRDAEQRFKLDPTRANQEGVAAAKANLDKISNDSGGVISKAQADIEDARQVVKISGIRRQTLSATTATSVAETAGVSKGLEADLRAAAQSALERGDNAGQDKAVAELRALRKSAGDLAKAVVDAGATTNEALRSATKQVEKQKQAAKATKESRAGG